MRIINNREELVVFKSGMHPTDTIEHLHHLKKDTYIGHQRLIEANPDWNRKTDARLLAIEGLIGLYDSTQFKLHILRHLLDDKWYEANMNTGDEHILSEPYKWQITSNFEQSIRFQFGMTLFTQIESNFRVFLRAIDPQNKAWKFHTVYTNLLSNHNLNFPQPDRNNTEELLELVGLIRNLIHNNGVYFNTAEPNKTMIYKGTKLNFYHNKPITFTFWSLLLSIANDIRSLLLKVINNPKIQAQNQILDPHASFITNLSSTP